MRCSSSLAWPVVVMLWGMPCAAAESDARPATTAQSPGRAAPAATTRSTQPSKTTQPAGGAAATLVSGTAAHKLADVDVKEFCKDDAPDFRLTDPSGTIFSACKGYLAGAVLESRRSGYGVGATVFDSAADARAAMEFRRHNAGTVIEPREASADHPQPWWASRKPDSIAFILFDNLVVEVYAKWGEKLDVPAAWQVAQKVATALQESSAQPPSPPPSKPATRPSSQANRSGTGSNAGKSTPAKPRRPSLP